MIVLHAKVPINPENRDEALELAETLVEHTNEEEGVIDYRAAIDLQDENTIRFFEQYEDAAAFGAHFETDHYQAFEQQIPEYLTGIPELVKFDVSGATELDP